jgi:hypothetical protein
MPSVKSDGFSTMHLHLKARDHTKVNCNIPRFGVLMNCKGPSQIVMVTVLVGSWLKCKVALGGSRVGGEVNAYL